MDSRAPATPGSPPNFQEMHYENRRSGSEAAAFGELVQSLQSQLSGTAIGFLVELQHATHRGVPARVLNAILHLCPPKKGAAMAGAHEPASHAQGAGEA